MDNKNHSDQSVKNAINIEHSDDDMQEIMQQFDDVDIAMAVEHSTNDYELLCRREQEETDAQLARRLMEEDNYPYSGANAISAVDHSSNDYEILRRAQEEADAEYARQLMEAENPPPTGADAGDAMDYVQEQNTQFRAQQDIQRKGHAYRKRILLDGIEAEEDEHERAIREQVRKRAELNEWRAERERQNAEFLESQRLDQLKEDARLALLSAPVSTHEPEPIAESISAATTINNDDDPPVPKTREELCEARLKALLSKKPSTQ
jgi:hypothetical protein